MGNCTVSLVSGGHQPVGSHLEVFFDITASSSYASGGDTIVAADIAALLLNTGYSLADVIFCTFEIPAKSLSYKASLDKSNSKLVVYDDSGEASGDLTTTPGAFRGRLVFGGIVKT